MMFFFLTLSSAFQEPPLLILSFCKLACLDILKGDGRTSGAFCLYIFLLMFLLVQRYKLLKESTSLPPNQANYLLFASIITDYQDIPINMFLVAV